MRIPQARMTGNGTGVRMIGFLAVISMWFSHGICLGQNSDRAVLYEPFDYPVGELNGRNGGTGFDTAWSSDEETVIVSPGLTYGRLEVGGNGIEGLNTANRFVSARGVSSALNGLLDDGDELWFSVIMGYGTGRETNTTLAFALATNPFTKGKYSYQINGAAGDNGLGVFMGRHKGKNYRISAAQFRDSNTYKTGFAGVVYGEASKEEFKEGPRLVVGKFEWGADKDVNRLPAGQEPGPWASGFHTRRGCGPVRVSCDHSRAWRKSGDG